MGKENIVILMGLHMMVTGSMIHRVDMEMSDGQTGQSTQADIQMGLRMALEFSSGAMGLFMRVTLQ